MKILDGQVALGNKSGTKDLGEHKVGEAHKPLLCKLADRNRFLVLENPTRSSAFDFILISESHHGGRADRYNQEAR